MRNLNEVILLTIVLAGCSGLNQPSAQVTAAQKRELLPLEKQALAPTFAAGVKDPAAAQFKWMPVVLNERDGITDYCGLVNGKNSYGRIHRLRPVLCAATERRQRSVYPAPHSARSSCPIREVNPLDPRWLNGICEKFGYDDFSQAR